jgi:hypothetical protein
LPELSAGFLVASSGTVQQPDGDVDAKAGEFRGSFSQPCWEIDHFDRSDVRREFNLEGDPSSVTSIDA